MKTIGWSAAMLVAAAGLLLAGAGAPSQGADLGASCCSDLEARIAELEATTLRKGNRVVSLQVFGEVGKALMYTDDERTQDVFVVDNENSGSRIGFEGKASLKAGWTVGYVMELDIQDAPSNEVSNGPNGDDGDESEISIRNNNFYIESDKLGRITIGHGSTAADSTAEQTLANTLRNSDVHHGNGFRIAESGRTLNGYADNLDGTRNDVIRYDSPAVMGFILSTSWGDNDYNDVALRWRQEISGFRFAAAIAYQWDEQSEVGNFETLDGSIAVSHEATGLFASFASGRREFTDVLEGLETSFWFAQGGIERKWLPLGATTLYGEYGVFESVSVEGAESKRLGFGLTQAIDSAAMEVYAQATFWSLDDPTEDTNDLTTVLVGSRVRF